MQAGGPARPRVSAERCRVALWHLQGLIYWFCLFYDCKCKKITLYYVFCRTEMIDPNLALSRWDNRSRWWSSCSSCTAGIGHKLILKWALSVYKNWLSVNIPINYVITNIFIFLQTVADHEQLLSFILSLVLSVLYCVPYWVKRKVVYWGFRGRPPPPNRGPG